MQVILSWSGGLDSSSLLLHLLRKGAKVKAISFYYAQKHQVELAAVENCKQYLAKQGLQLSHEVIDLQAAFNSFHSALTDNAIDVPKQAYEINSMRDTFVPNRNAIFASILYGMALSWAKRSQRTVQLALGVHAGDHTLYPDCRPEFYKNLSTAFELGNWDSDLVNFYLPFIAYDKAEILQAAYDDCSALKLDFKQFFSNTHSCYDPPTHQVSCGSCGACQERLVAFASLGTSDPITYHQKINQNE